MQNNTKNWTAVTILYLLFLSILVLWKMLISRCGGRVTEAIDVSSLAKITDGYTPGHMVQAIEQILTERRIQQVRETDGQTVLRYPL